MTLPKAVFTTDPHDFLNNTYYGASPFEIHGEDIILLRIVSKNTPAKSADKSLSRVEKLTHAMERGEALFQLEFTFPQQSHPWKPIVEIHLMEQATTDLAGVRFSPFHTGQDIQPRGFVHFTRHLPYVFSQFGRGALGEQLEELEEQSRQLLSLAREKVHKEPVEETRKAGS